MADISQPAFDLHTTYVHLEDGGAARHVHVGPDFWAKIGERADLHAGRLVTSFRMTDDWDHWEMHPAGDELIVLVSGAVEFRLQNGGGERTVEVRGRAGPCWPRWRACPSWRFPTRRKLPIRHAHPPRSGSHHDRERFCTLAVPDPYDHLAGDPAASPGSPTRAPRPGLGRLARRAALPQQHIGLLNPARHLQPRGATTTMEHHRGQDHHDVPSSWSGPGLTRR